VNRIEQVKKILYQGYLTDIAAEKINALYSEPHVVSKPEQMVICPKIGACQHPIPRFCGHDKPHVTKINCANTAGNCPACIPVPTPASEGMLLTGEELADVIDSITPPRQIGRKLSEQDISAIADCMGEVAVQVAKAQLLKCHQSEAAIRADQNKKIATWIQKNDNHFIFHFIPECGGDFCFLATEGMENECTEPDEGAGYCQYRDKCRYANKQLLFGQNFIAKLQKGEEIE
jgi:hypothetical protein